MTLMNANLQYIEALCVKVAMATGMLGDNVDGHREKGAMRRVQKIPVISSRERE